TGLPPGVGEQRLRGGDVLAAQGRAVVLVAVLRGQDQMVAERPRGQSDRFEDGVRDGLPVDRPATARRTRSSVSGPELPLRASWVRAPSLKASGVLVTDIG